MIGLETMKEVDDKGRAAIFIGMNRVQHLRKFQFGESEFSYRRRIFQ